MTTSATAAQLGPWRRRWYWASLGSMACGGGAVLLYQLLFIRPRTGEVTRLMPLLTELGLYAVPVVAAGLTGIGYALVRTAAKRRDSRALARRITSAGSAGLLALGVGVALAVGLLTTHPDFPLGPTLIARQASPDGRHVGYLYRRFLGSLVAYRRARGDITLHRQAEHRGAPEGLAPALRWRADGALDIVGPGGAPLPQAPGWNFGIRWH